MGGDGGVIASKRQYMRGVGQADHTGDAATNTHATVVDPTVERQEAARAMTTCALSQEPLWAVTPAATATDTSLTPPQQQIVCCSLGRLYRKEAAVEALLRRKQLKQGGDVAVKGDELGTHVRGLKDLYTVQFHLVASTKSKSNTNTNASTSRNSKSSTEAVATMWQPACPVTGIELNGQTAAFALIPGSPPHQVNVVSERAIRQLDEESLAAEYGPIQQKIRLAPPSSMIAGIRQTIQTKQQQEANDNFEKKKQKKNKRKRIEGL